MSLDEKIKRKQPSFLDARPSRWRRSCLFTKAIENGKLQPTILRLGAKQRHANVAADDDASTVVTNDDDARRYDRCYQNQRWSLYWR